MRERGKEKRNAKKGKNTGEGAAIVGLQRARKEPSKTKTRTQTVGKFSRERDKMKKGSTTAQEENGKKLLIEEIPRKESVVGQKLSY